MQTGDVPREACFTVFRLGVWMDYGETLGPSDGIGVFVHNLVHGLLDLDESIEVVLQIHPGDECVVETLVRKAPGRVQLNPGPHQTRGFRQIAYGGLAGWVRASDRVKHRVADRRKRAARWVDLAGRSIREYMWSVVTRASRQWWRDLLLAVTLLPALCLLIWLVYSVWQVLAAAARIALLPVERLDHLVRRISRTRRRISRKNAVASAKQSGCDVWILPHVGFTQPIDFPSVLFIHDLVPFHYPEGFDPTLVHTLKRIIPARAREATLCACMSRFIEQHDLEGVLGLPPGKVRMIRPAPPSDFPRITGDQARLLLPSELQRPFLFYPAAFRPYKNHARMIMALQVLRDEMGEDRFDVVFTGRQTGEMPVSLERLADQTNTRHRIHILGHLERSVLAALYKEAFATLMLSLYEQGSFPVYEALHWGCPVASADIPSMREQCREMADSMLYFDPTDPRSIAQVICTLRDRREPIRQEQQRTGSRMWQRTWKDVAADWLPIFREAAAISRANQSRAA